MPTSGFIATLLLNPKSVRWGWLVISNAQAHSNPTRVFILSIAAIALLCVARSLCWDCFIPILLLLLYLNPATAAGTEGLPQLSQKSKWLSILLLRDRGSPVSHVALLHWKPEFGPTGSPSQKTTRVLPGGQPSFWRSRRFCGRCQSRWVALPSIKPPLLAVGFLFKFYYDIISVSPSATG